MYEEILKKYNYSPSQLNVPGQSKPMQLSADERIKEIDNLLAGSSATTDKTLSEKIASFTGGDVLAKGLGQGLAMGDTKKMLDQTQKVQGEQQQKLIDAINKNKAAGKDTTRLEQSLKDLTTGIAETGSNAENLLNPNQITGKQIAGDALQLATTVVGAGELPGAAKTITVADTVGKGVVQGAKTGAKFGAIAGASEGTSQGLKQNKTSKEIATQAIENSLLGAAGGTIVGGAIGGVAGKINGTSSTKEQKLYDRIRPNVNEITPTEYEKLLTQRKILPKTTTSPAQYILSDGEKEVAKKYSSILNSNDPVKNSINVIKEISNKDKMVGEYLKKNNGIFNDGELKNYITDKLQGVTDITVDENRLNQAKKIMIENFVENLKKNDQVTLWQARKAFDKQIEKIFSGSPNLQNNLKREFRNAVQDFISEKTDNVTYKGYMKDMRELFNLQDVLSTKAVKEKNYSAIGKWLKDNPKKAKALGLSASAVVGGKILQNVLN